MKTDLSAIPVSEFKTTCLSVLDQVRRTGNGILVTKRGKPIAMISPPPAEKKPTSWLGCLADQGKITGDIVSPVVPEDQWDALR